MVNPIGLSSVAVVVVAAVVIAVSPVAIPTVIVLRLAAVGLPIPLIVLLRFIARADPNRSLIRRPRVVSVVPDVTISGRWIPVTVHPYVARSRVSWANAQHARRRRSPDPDPYGELSERYRSPGQYQQSQ